METEVPSSTGSRWSRVASSLPVRNVQDLAACPEEMTAQTLERYIRPDIGVLVEKSSEVPVIDLGKLFNPRFVEEEAARLRFACEDWGFFQLVNHGIADEIIANIRSGIQRFFQLPLEVKCAYAQVPGSLQGYGQSFVVSEGQKLDWCDRFSIIAQPPQARDMKYWPTQPHTFRKSINDYSSELMKIIGSVVHFIAKALNIDLKLMDDKYVSQVLRMNYYPPCMTMAEKVLGLSPHSDASFLTILLEINSVEGLQIKRHNAWITVKPNPKALLVNVGDFLEKMLPSLKDHPTVKAWEWIETHVHINGIHGISIYEDLRDKSSQVKLKLQNVQSNSHLKFEVHSIIQLTNSFGCVRLYPYGCIIYLG